MRRPLILLCVLLAPLAAAQVGVPGVRLPQLPAVTPPGFPQAGTPVIPEAAGAGALDPLRLRELRGLRVRELLRRHRDLIEADPHGAPMVRGEVLALAPTAAGLAAASAAGLRVEREMALEELGLRIVVLHAGGDTARSRARLAALDPNGAYDFNHLFLESAARGVTALSASGGHESSAVQEPPAAPATHAVGLIDTGLDAAHEVFAGLALHQHGCGGHAVPAAHGTAVASLLVGRAAALRGAASGSALYAADVFCGQPTGGAVDTVAEAFAWLLHEHVAVINVSLVGPPNRVLESVVAAVLARGHLVVAAVGNDGPAAPPLYPAAWPGVLGVTAVDARLRVLAEAERGVQVKFAAPGADMAAAKPGGGYQLVRGTSFAAPIVAGLLAPLVAAPDPAAAGQAIAALRRAAQPPGPSIPPSAYGYGLVGAQLRQQPALAALRTD
jgi:hypothetical protein